MLKKAYLIESTVLDTAHYFITRLLDAYIVREELLLSNGYLVQDEGIVSVIEVRIDDEGKIKSRYCVKP